mmetsp:Transcript_34719/g.66023  ORF Transcript_34719/g.66023 Transcript_34719/m.66023 type:complete len:198 (+) Transcript_34719:447-1040(+)
MDNLRRPFVSDELEWLEIEMTLHFLVSLEEVDGFQSLEVGIINLDSVLVPVGIKKGGGTTVAAADVALLLLFGDEDGSGMATGETMMSASVPQQRESTRSSCGGADGGGSGVAVAITGCESFSSCRGGSMVMYFSRGSMMIYIFRFSGVGIGRVCLYLLLSFFLVMEALENSCGCYCYCTIICAAVITIAITILHNT